MTGTVPIIAIIVAVAENGVIGACGKMPWHLPSELKYFRFRTIGKPIIMGRKTFQSIGKPLPGRDNIVVTRDSSFAAAGVTVVASLAAAITAARACAAASGAGEIMIAGGGEIYRQALPLASRLYLTRIKSSPAGDAHFPLPTEAEWRLVEEREIPRGERDTAAATAQVFDRVAQATPAR